MRSARILLLALVLAGCAGSGEPRPNLTHAKWRMIEWHDSGGYLRAFSAAADGADRVLQGHLENLPPGAAVVFDIDETLLSNWHFLRGNDFGMTMPAFAPWAQQAGASALEPMQKVFAKARAYRIPIFLISGRPESLRSATERNLNAAGFWGWTRLYLRLDSDHSPSVVPFKSGIRQMLAQEGFDVLLNVGDQQSDLEGGYARHHVKLPNPFYFLP